MATKYTEHTPGGQVITIRPAAGVWPVRIDFQGAHLISSSTAAAVETRLQDAREIHAALGKLLAAYDAEDDSMPPAEPYDQGTLNEAFVGTCAGCGCNDLAGNHGDAADCGCKCHRPLPDFD